MTTEFKRKLEEICGKNGFKFAGEFMMQDDCYISATPFINIFLSQQCYLLPKDEDKYHPLSSKNIHALLDKTARLKESIKIPGVNFSKNDQRNWKDSNFDDGLGKGIFNDSWDHELKWWLPIINIDQKVGERERKISDTWRYTPQEADIIKETLKDAGILPKDVRKTFYEEIESERIISQEYKEKKEDIVINSTICVVPSREVYDELMRIKPKFPPTHAKYDSRVWRKVKLLNLRHGGDICDKKAIAYFSEGLCYQIDVEAYHHWFPDVPVEKLKKK